MLKKLLRENLIVKSRLGLAAACAVSATAAGGLLYGLLSAVVLALAGGLLALCARPLHGWARVVAAVVLAAGLWAAADAAARALFYETASALGWYPSLAAASGLFVVYLPTLAAERPARAAATGCAAGLGYALVLVLAGLVREPLAFGSLFGLSLGYEPPALFAGPFGGFFVLAIVCAGMQKLAQKGATA